MPGNEEDQEPDRLPLSPDWGGVPRSGGDNADATGGFGSTEVDEEPPAAEAGEDAPTSEGEGDPAEDAAEAPAAEADSAD